MKVFFVGVFLIGCMLLLKGFGAFEKDIQPFEIDKEELIARTKLISLHFGLSVYDDQQLYSINMFIKNRLEDTELGLSGYDRLIDQINSERLTKVFILLHDQQRFNEYRELFNHFYESDNLACKEQNRLFVLRRDAPVKIDVYGGSK